MRDRHLRRGPSIPNPRRGPSAGLRLDGHRFSQHVRRACTRIPHALKAHLQQVELRVHDVPEQLPETSAETRMPADLLHRVSITEHGLRLTLFRLPILLYVGSRDELDHVLTMVIADAITEHFGEL